MTSHRKIELRGWAHIRALPSAARTIALCAAVSLAVTPAAAQTPDAGRNAGEARAAGEGALRELLGAVNKQNSKGLGFDSPEEARQAVVGEPIEVVSIRLDELQGFAPTANPEGLLRRPAQYFLPIFVGSALRSVLEMARVENAWKGVSLGPATTLRKFEELRVSKARGLNRPRGSFFVVRVLALRLTFLAHREGSGLFLTPVVDYPRLGLKAGSTQAAREVLQLVTPAARRLDRNAPG